MLSQHHRRWRNIKPTYPANTSHSPNAVPMLGQSQRRWANIEAALGECSCFLGRTSISCLRCESCIFCTKTTIDQTHVSSMLSHRRVIAYDAGTTLIQIRINLLHCPYCLFISNLGQHRRRPPRLFVIEYIIENTVYIQNICF